jgi:chromosome segregation ATPase
VGEPVPKKQTQDFNPFKNELTTMFESLNKKVDTRLTSMEAQQKDDHSAIKAIQVQIQKVETNLDRTHNVINTMETSIMSTIDSSVKSHITSYTKTLEEHLHATLQATATLLEGKNEERHSAFRHEHQNFVMEFRAAQDKQAEVNHELQSMIRQLIVRTSESEIVFHDHPSSQDNEGSPDLSFTCDHE